MATRTTGVSREHERVLLRFDLSLVTGRQAAAGTLAAPCAPVRSPLPSSGRALRDISAVVLASVRRWGWGGGVHF